MIRAGEHLVLSLWDEAQLRGGGRAGRAADDGVPPFTLAHNVATRDEVDAVLAEARARRRRGDRAGGARLGRLHRLLRRPRRRALGDRLEPRPDRAAACSRERWRSHRADASLAAMTAPSGEQFEIAAGGYRAVVTECGAALRVLEHAGRPLLDGFAEDEMSPGGRGQLLVPWPNRIRDGAYSFDGRDLQLGLTEPARHNAIHGLARWAAWTPEEHTADVGLARATG